MPLDIRSIEQEVRRAPTVQKSVMTLIQLVSTALSEVKKNPDQLDALIERFRNNHVDLARAVISNTRMAGEEVDPPAEFRLRAMPANPVPAPVEHPSGNPDARPEPLATPIHSDVNPPTAQPTEERRRALDLARIGTQEHQELGAWKGGEGPLNPDPRDNPADQFPSMEIQAPPPPPPLFPNLNIGRFGQKPEPQKEPEPPSDLMTDVAPGKENPTT